MDELRERLRQKYERLTPSERRIAEWLAAHGIAYRYDNRFRIIKGYAIRPDFYLPEHDLYIEYWGMDTLDYQIGMLEKKKLTATPARSIVMLEPPRAARASP